MKTVGKALSVQSTVFNFYMLVVIVIVTISLWLILIRNFYGNDLL